MSKKAVFFNAGTGDFRDIQYEGLDDIYKAIGCDLVGIALELGTGDVVFVDDEAWLGQPAHIFKMMGRGPFAGHAVIVGPADEEGNTLDVTMTAKEFEESLEFQIGFILPKEGWDHPSLQNIFKEVSDE